MSSRRAYHVIAAAETSKRDARIAHREYLVAKGYGERFRSERHHASQFSSPYMAHQSPLLMLWSVPTCERI